MYHKKRPLQCSKLELEVKGAVLEQITKEQLVMSNEI